MYTYANALNHSRYGETLQLSESIAINLKKQIH